MADWCTVHLLAEDGGVQRVAATHRDPDKQDLLRRLEELQPQGLSDGSETAQVLRGGDPVLLREVTGRAGRARHRRPRAARGVPRHRHRLGDHRAAARPPAGARRPGAVHRRQRPAASTRRT
jgi:hypothetical protein